MHLYYVAIIYQPTTMQDHKYVTCCDSRNHYCLHAKFINTLRRCIDSTFKFQEVTHSMIKKNGL